MLPSVGSTIPVIVNSALLSPLTYSVPYCKSKQCTLLWWMYTVYSHCFDGSHKWQQIQGGICYLHIVVCIVCEWLWRHNLHSGGCRGVLWSSMNPLFQRLKSIINSRLLTTASKMKHMYLDTCLCTWMKVSCSTYLDSCWRDWTHKLLHLP